jgi:EAL domain-containing protein (putative c-di-GMP-specific phosphodiesterase class I)/CheY-like chemotaxis protein
VNKENPTAEHVLILDDTVEIAELIGILSRKAGFKSTVTTDVDAFNDALERETPNIIILDLQIPKSDGVQILRQLSADSAAAGILLVTGMDRRTIDSAEKFGRKAGLNMLGTLQKPFAPELLIKKLESARDATRQLTGADLGAAIDDATMKLYFQPVVRRLAQGTWHTESVEALPRWHHPALGLLTPGQFLSLAGSERSGLMQRLTDFVLQRGIEQLHVWQQGGLHLGLRVNVAAGLITDTDFPDRLESLIQQNQTDPALLTLEISDSTSLGNSRDGIGILTRLRLKEINLALDDFGAAGQPINTLFTLPLNEVKIDRCVTADLTVEHGAPVLFRGLVDVARQLGMVCCAEGVETAGQLDVLDDIGCDLAQGFHIGKPMPATAIPKAIAGWTAEVRPRAKSSAGG